MKKRHLTVICCLALFCVVQSASAQQKTRIGLGVGLTNGGSSLDSYSSILSPTSLFVPITFEEFRLEPELGYFSYSEKDTPVEASASVVHLGTGLFYVQAVNSTNFYYGARLAVDLISSSSEYPGNTNESSSTNFSVGPAFGGEHLFGDNFSLGGEVQVLYTSVGNDEDSSDASRSMIRSRALFFVRWHFGGNG